MVWFCVGLVVGGTIVGLYRTRHDRSGNDVAKMLDGGDVVILYGAQFEYIAARFSQYWQLNCDACECLSKSADQNIGIGYTPMDALNQLYDNNYGVEHERRLGRTPSGMEGDRS